MLRRAYLSLLQIVVAIALLFGVLGDAVDSAQASPYGLTSEADEYFSEDVWLARTNTSDPADGDDAPDLITVGDAFRWEAGSAPRSVHFLPDIPRRAYSACAGSPRGPPSA
jgi:hypothetical protein